MDADFDRVPTDHDVVDAVATDVVAIATVSTDNALGDFVVTVDIASTIVVVRIHVASDVTDVLVMEFEIYV
jgi:hypothetical protein